MGFRGNNSRTFAKYVELVTAIDEYSPNAYLFKRRDSETNKPVSERSLEQMIYSFLEDKKSYVRFEMMGKK